jgi:riboflavin kinase/FMN adenylyltransferase
MKTIQISKDNLIAPSESLTICLGYFDGVHLGHKQIIHRAVREGEYDLGVLTFDVPVSSLLDNKKSKEVLTSLNDRFRIIDRLGVDYYFVLHIDKDFLEMEPLEFINILQKLNVKEVYVGEDYRFGKDRKGDINLLKKYFYTEVIKLLRYDGKKISSQDIIALLKEGKIDKANALLGQNYSISGTVVEGHHNGEKLGIRTANVKPAVNYVFPKFGVYKVIAYIEGIPHLAIANVGVHPTIIKEAEPLIEVHIPNYENEDYGKSIMVEFLEFVRPEKTFKDKEALVKQVKEDIAKIGL